MRVFYCEDENSVAAGTIVILELNGHEVVHVRSAAEAEAAVIGEVFDVLLTDLDLGNGPDGFEVIRNVRHSSPRLPVAILSGRETIPQMACRLVHWFFFENRSRRSTSCERWTL